MTLTHWQTVVKHLLKLRICSEMFDVKSGVPVPAKGRSGRPLTADFPFSDMQRGQSFFVPLGNGVAKTSISRLRARASNWRKTTGLDSRFRMVACTHPDTGEKAIGVWRVS